jgi:hypothetical protein
VSGFWDRKDIRVDRLIDTTIALMAILVVYDGWTTLSFVGVALAIVGPILAIFVGHVYSVALGTRVELGRPLTGSERRRLLALEARFLLVAVPLLAILTVLSAFGVSYPDIIFVIIVVGMLSLGFWGAVAGRRAGLTGWALVASIGYGLLVGAVIVVVAVVLRPGRGSLQALSMW